MISMRQVVVSAWVLAGAYGVCPADVAAQGSRSGAPFGGSMDDAFRRDAARGEGMPSRAFGFAARADSPVAIVRVDEERQARGRTRFVLNLVNNSAQRVPSFEIVALVVGAAGQVTGVEALPVARAMKAGQTARHEMELRSVSLVNGDRVAFVVARIDGDAGWTAPEADLRGMAVEAAALLFPPQ